MKKESAIEQAIDYFNERTPDVEITVTDEEPEVEV